jgi:hypothetical protein
MARLLAEKSKRSERTVNGSQSGSAIDTYEMANLYPRDTGLPMTVWVSPRGRAWHDARVKVCLTHGDRMDATNIAAVAIRPVPRIVSGQLMARDFALVSSWIALNECALLAYWDGTLSTIELAGRLRRLPD